MRRPIRLGVRARIRGLGFRGAQRRSTRRGSCSATCNSDQRLPALIRLVVNERPSRKDGLVLLGETWSFCDNIGRYQEDVEMVFLPMTGPVSEMMTATEQAALAALPEVGGRLPRCGPRSE